MLTCQPQWIQRVHSGFRVNNVNILYTENVGVPINWKENTTSVRNMRNYSARRYEDYNKHNMVMYLSSIVLRQTMRCCRCYQIICLSPSWCLIGSCNSFLSNPVQLNLYRAALAVKSPPISPQRLDLEERLNRSNVVWCLYS